MITRVTDAGITGDPHSTRADVEELLGRANDESYGAIYLTKDESVSLE